MYHKKEQGRTAFRIQEICSSITMFWYIRISRKLNSFFIPKKNKNVLLLSSLHHDDETENERGDKNKPVIITDYYRTKGGVNSSIHMLSLVSLTIIQRLFGKRVLPHQI